MSHKRTKGEYPSYKGKANYMEKPKETSCHVFNEQANNIIMEEGATGIALTCGGDRLTLIFLKFQLFLVHFPKAAHIAFYFLRKLQLIYLLD